VQRACALCALPTEPLGRRGGLGYIRTVIRWIRALLSGPRAAPPADTAETAESAEHEPQDADAPDTDEIVVMPIEDSIDLHTFAPRDIPSVVEEYLHEAWQRGFEEVRVIHGRGKGVQRRAVHDVLARHPAVDAYRDAPASRGGWGATLVWLKPRTAPAPATGDTRDA